MPMASKKKDKGFKEKRQSNEKNLSVRSNINMLGQPLQHLSNSFLRLPFNCSNQPPDIFQYPSILNNWQQTSNHQNQKVCNLCKREPRFSCARCGSYYCSQECQRNDWQSHRFWCFAMPSLVPLNAVSRTTPPVAPLPKNQSTVRVTGFRRPNVCYVRSLEPADNDLFLKSMNTINNYGTSAQYITELPASNTYAIAFYERQYNRVQVLSALSEDGIRVLFIDKGFVKTLQIKDLRKATDNVIRILQQAVAVKLKGVANYILTDEIENFLLTFCEKEFRLVYSEDNGDREFVLEEIHSENVLNVCIISFANKQTNFDVYAEFKITENAERGASSKQKEQELKANVKAPHESNMRKLLSPVLKPPFEIIQFDENDKNFCVSVLDESRIEYGLFGCIARNNGKYLDRIAGYLNNYVDNGIIYEPLLHEYCLAQIGKQWCRIKILNIYKKIYTIVNIDSTAEEKIKCDKIRRCPDDLNVPCVTVLCKIYGLEPISGNRLIAEFMKQRFTIKSLHRINKVKKVEDSICTVQMDDLIAELILDVNIK